MIDSMSLAKAIKILCKRNQKPYQEALRDEPMVIAPTKAGLGLKSVLLY